MSDYGLWEVRRQQHWRIETDSSGMLARVWLVDADGTEHQLHYVYGCELSIDANRRYDSNDPSVQLTIRVSGDVEIFASPDAARIAAEPTEDCDATATD